MGSVPVIDASCSAQADNEIGTVLRRDPSGVFCEMDARSQEDYQALVEKWSARSNRGTSEIAEIAVDLAEESCRRHGAADRRSHVGYYLLGKGVASLAAVAGIDLTWKDKLGHDQPLWLLPAYFGLTIAISMVYSLAAMLFEFDLSVAGHALVALPAMIYCFCLAPAWTIGILYGFFKAHRLPRLDFSAGIPDRFKTLVVVPCLFPSMESVRKLVQTLEALYLDNANCGAGFCLLSDFVDAPTESTADDASIVDGASALIASLNERHGGGFVLLHRPRRWNPNEGCWMGRERKRGKLEELNAFLVEKDAENPFQRVSGDTDMLSNVEFVVTLDEDDTHLVPGAVGKFAASLAHPLNRPLLSADGNTVAAGYGVLQPRPMLKLPEDSLPNRLELLIDMLVSMANPVPQSVDAPMHNLDFDAYGQVPYIGKGIYDVKVFHRTLNGRIPENAILSHDLLEGAFVRAGTVSDIVLPVPLLTYRANAQRNHRWMRGDWQLLPWLFCRMRTPSGARVEIPSFARWKIIDNAIRMLLPTAALACLAIGWLTCSNPGYWTMALLITAWAPSILEIVYVLLKRVRTENFVSLCRWLWIWVLLKSAGLIFVIHEAQVSLDAIVRSSYRMLISKRKMLEWRASSMISAQCDPTLPGYFGIMWLSPAFAIALAWLIHSINPIAMPVALPFLLTWIGAPWIAWWFSQTPEPQVTPSRLA